MTTTEEQNEPAILGQEEAVEAAGAQQGLPMPQFPFTQVGMTPQGPVFQHHLAPGLMLQYALSAEDMDGFAAQWQNQRVVWHQQAEEAMRQEQMQRHPLILPESARRPPVGMNRATRRNLRND